MKAQIDLTDFTTELLQKFEKLIDEKLEAHFHRLIEALPEREKKLFTVQQVADKLQVSRTSVHRWIQLKKLKSSQPGGTRRISEADFAEFVNSKPRYLMKRKRI